MIEYNATLDDLTEDQFQIGRVLWEQGVSTEYKDASDKSVQDNILDVYFAVEFEPKEIREMLEFIETREKEVKYYDDEIELDDEKVDWEIPNREDIAPEEYQMFIDNKKEEYMFAFKKITGEEVTRCGQHIGMSHMCVKNSWENFVNYFYLQDEYIKCKKDMLEDIKNLNK